MKETIKIIVLIIVLAGLIGVCVYFFNLKNNQTEDYYNYLYDDSYYSEETEDVTDEEIEIVNEDSTIESEEVTE